MCWMSSLPPRDESPGTSRDRVERLFCWNTFILRLTCWEHHKDRKRHGLCAAAKLPRWLSSDHLKPTTESALKPSWTYKRVDKARKRLSKILFLYGLREEARVDKRRRLWLGRKKRGRRHPRLRKARLMAPLVLIELSEERNWVNKSVYVPFVHIHVMNSSACCSVCVSVLASS